MQYILWMDQEESGEIEDPDKQMDDLGRRNVPCSKYRTTSLQKINALSNSIIHVLTGIKIDQIKRI